MVSLEGYMTRLLCKRTRSPTQQIELVFRTFGANTKSDACTKHTNTDMLYKVGHFIHIYLHHHRHKTGEERYDLLQGIGKHSPVKMNRISK